MKCWKKDPHTIKILKVPEEDEFDGSVCSAAGVSGWPTLSHSKPVSIFRMAGKPSLRYQHLSTWSGYNAGFLHSSPSSQRVQTSIARALYLKLY